jgi:hypothetical protein
MSQIPEVSQIPEASRTTSGASPRTAPLAVVVGAVAAALVLWIVAEPVLGIDLRAPASGGAPNSEVGPVMVVLGSLVPVLLGWGLLVLLQKFTAHARTVWTVIAGVILAGSLVGPLSGEGITGANRVVLLLMHLVVGAVLIIGLRRTSPGKDHG